MLPKLTPKQRERIAVGGLYGATGGAMSSATASHAQSMYHGNKILKHAKNAVDKNLPDDTRQSHADKLAQHTQKLHDFANHYPKLAGISTVGGALVGGVAAKRYIKRLKNMSKATKRKNEEMKNANSSG